MGGEGNTDEMGSDVARPLIDPPVLQAHSRDRAVNGFVQRGVDRVGAKGNTCQRPPGESGFGQQMRYSSHVYRYAANQ